MITNNFSHLNMNNVFVPLDILTKILIEVKDPRVAKVCKMFNYIINRDFYWECIGSDFATYDLAVKQGMESIKENASLIKAQDNSDLANGVKLKIEIPPGSIKAFVLEYIKVHTNSIKAINPRVLGLKKQSPLDADYHGKLTTFLQLFLKCEVKGQSVNSKNFNLSHSYDENFDDAQIGSIDYCILYMKNFIEASEMFECLLSKCKEYQPNFILSSQRDSNFDDKKQSLDYCIQYLKNYLVNMYDLSGILAISTIEELKEYLENS